MHPIWFAGEWKSEQWTAAGSLAAVAVAVIVAGMTYVAVRHNGAMVEEMKRARLESTKPVILLDFVNRGLVKGICIRAKNYGGPAADVSFSFVPPLRNSEGVDIGSTPILGSRHSIIGPDESFEVRFDGGAYFDVDFYLSGRITEFTVTVDCRDPATREPFPPSVIRIDLATLVPIWGDRSRIFHAMVSEPIDYYKNDGATDPFSVEKAQSLLDEAIESLEQYPSIRELRLQSSTLDEAATRHLWSRGWYIRSGPKQTIAIKERGSHEGVIVVASGWNLKVINIFLAQKAIEVDRQYGEP